VTQGSITLITMTGTEQQLRTMSKSIGFSRPSRKMVSVTLLPRSPRIFFMASSRESPSVETPSILMIRSPPRMPAFQAGVPSIGAMTASRLSLIPIWMPTPPNSPLVSTWVSLYISGVMYAECGSSVASMPLMAL
jgi:hypothetical protein